MWRGENSLGRRVDGANAEAEASMASATAVDFSMVMLRERAVVLPVCKCVSDRPRERKIGLISYKREIRISEF